MRTSAFSTLEPVYSHYNTCDMCVMMSRNLGLSLMQKRCAPLSGDRSLQWRLQRRPSAWASAML
eukprot:5706135-Amphidinium_carterae.1